MSNSKNHHWWPKGVSAFWKGGDGCCARVSPDGTVLRQQPAKFGFIGHGHSIKLGRIPGETTVWDQNFEHFFQQADDNFPETIRWLERLSREAQPNARSLRDRFLAQDAPKEKLARLLEGLISLAVRSPMNREAAAINADSFRGHRLPERERNAIIALNIRDRQKMLIDNIGGRGKFAVLYSPDREFIFGDGFLHNLTTPSGPPIVPQVLAPLTPRITVLFASPLQYIEKPKLSTVVVTPREADALNYTVQIYAREMLFYRSEPPVLTEEFRRGQHLEFSGPSRPIDKLISAIPGVLPRDYFSFAPPALPPLGM